MFCIASDQENQALSITNSAAYPTLRVDRHQDMQRKLERFAGKHFDIIFDGDSIMNRWETTGKVVWAQRYAGIAADFGIEGDRVENLLWRLDHGQVDGINPKVVVFMIGTNNSGCNSAAEIAQGIRMAVAEYEKRCPHAQIILMAVFPRGQSPADPGRIKVTAVNALIKPLGKSDPRVSFIDIGPQLIEHDGTISTNMMPDFVHPTIKGYRIWAKSIQPIIDKYVHSEGNAR